MISVTFAKKRLDLVVEKIVAVIKYNARNSETADELADALNRPGDIQKHLLWYLPFCAWNLCSINSNILDFCMGLI